MIVVRSNQNKVTPTYLPYTGWGWVSNIAEARKFENESEAVWYMLHQWRQFRGGNDSRDQWMAWLADWLLRSLNDLEYVRVEQVTTWEEV